MSGRKKLIEETANLAKRVLSREPELRTIKGADLLKKTEGLTEDPFGFSKFSKPLSEMEYTVRMRGNRDPYKSVEPYDFVKQDATIAGHISDRTAAGRDLVNVGGDDLVDPLHQRGGADYQRTTLNAWANRPGAAKGLNRKLNEAAGYEWDKKKKEFIPKAGSADIGKPVYTTPVFMGAGSANSSHMVGIPLIRMIPNLPISKGDKMAFDAMMSERFPGWPGIDKTKEAEQFMYSGKIPGSTISKFIDYASAKKWRGAGFPDVSEIMFSSMDPRLVGVPQGTSGMGFKEFSPGRTPIIKSNDYHPDYPAAIPGKEYIGGFKYQVPPNLMFPDWWKSLKPELRLPENATKAQHTLMTQVPRQKATAEWADPIMEYWEKNPVPWGYASGGEVDDDVNDALRIAKDVGGATNENPQVFMTDAQGRQYDATGKVIQPSSDPAQSNATAQPQPQQPENINKMFNAAPQNYETEVQPLIDYAMTPIDRPGMSSEPDLVQAMKVATQVAAEGQQENADTRGTGNLARRREELVNSIYGANPERPNDPSSNQAWIANRMIDFSPWALAEVAHDIPYEAGRTGDYGTAAVEGGLNAAFTAPVMGLAGRGIKKGYQALKNNPYLTAGAAGAIGLTADPAQAEAGPARWFSKALEVAQAIPMEKMTGEQALAMLRRSVSPEELRWTGTDKFLSSTPKLSKGELIDHLQKNRLTVNEVMLGGDKPSDIRDVQVQDIPKEIRDKYMPNWVAANEEKMRLGEAIRKYKADLKAAGKDYIGDPTYSGLLESQQQQYKKMDAYSTAMRQEYVDSIGGLAKKPKYESYSTHGGKGYRENVYTLPKRDIYTPFIEKMKNEAWKVNYDEAIVNGFAEDRAKKFADSFNNLEPHQLAKFLNKEDELNRVFEEQKFYDSGYKSSHWDDPNVLFHTRSQTLTYDPPGANRPYSVHNVDETQSDWGQDARKRGVKYADQERLLRESRANLTELIKRVNAENHALDEEFYAKTAPYRKKRDEADELLKEKWRRGEISVGDYNRMTNDNYEKFQNEISGFSEESNAKRNEIIKPLQDEIDQQSRYIKSLGEKKDAVNAAPFITSTEGWTDRAIKQELDKALDGDADYFSWSPGAVHADRYDLSKHIDGLTFNPSTGKLRAIDPDGNYSIDENITDDQLDDYVGKELGDKIRAQVEALPMDEDTLQHRGIVELNGLDLKVGGEGMIGYYDKLYFKRVQDVLKKATGQKPEIEVIEVQTADGPRKQLGIRLTDEMREKARFSDFNRGGTVTGSHSYGNDGDVVNTALALTREY